MRTLQNVTQADVQAIYDGAEGRLWELLMGEQIHVGGLASSMDLAERAQIREESAGVDLCCCTGAGMRFLTRFRNVRHMTGVDATPRVIELGRRRNAEQGLAERIEFVQADVCRTGLSDSRADFAWGEDAWCYVADKSKLIHEAARLLRPGGTIAFTDWVEGPRAMSDAEARRFMQFMKFPSFATIADYVALLERAGCRVRVAEDTRRFPSCIDLYLNMISTQLTYDALRIIGFDQAMLGALGDEMKFIQSLAHDGKVIQAIFVATKV